MRRKKLAAQCRVPLLAGWQSVCQQILQLSGVFFVSSGGIAAEKIASSCSLRSGYQIVFCPWSVLKVNWSRSETQEYKSQQIQQNTLKLLVWIWDSDRGLQKKAECDYLTSALDDAPDCTNHHRVKKLILLNMRWIISFPENTAGPWTGRPGRSSSLLEAAKWNKNTSGGNIRAASRK